MHRLASLDLASTPWASNRAAPLVRDEQAPIRGEWRPGVRSACDSERRTTVTHGSHGRATDAGKKSWKASALVRALDTSLKLVVRGRVELPTFR